MRRFEAMTGQGGSGGSRPAFMPSSVRNQVGSAAGFFYKLLRSSLLLAFAQPRP